MRDKVWPINWIQWITLGLVVALIGVVSMGVVALDNQAKNTNAGLHNFICFFESAVLSSPNQNSVERRRAINFFNEANKRIQEPACQAVPEKGATNG